MTATAARRVLARSDEVARIIARLAHEIVEPNQAQEGLVLLGVRRGSAGRAARCGDRAHQWVQTRSGLSEHQSLPRRPYHARAAGFANSRRRLGPSRHRGRRRVVHRSNDPFGAGCRDRSRAPGGDSALRSRGSRLAGTPDSARLRRPLYADVTESTSEGRPLARSQYFRRSNDIRTRRCGSAVA